jgi:LPS-assembly protein
MKHDQGLPFGFRGRVDLDIVSDQDYLTEYRNRYSGFNETREYFRSAFGRDLDDYDDPIRTNQAIVTREWDRFSLNGGIVWLDDTTQRWTEEVAADVAGPKLNTQLQRLPLISFDAIRQPLGNTPLLFNMNTEWTYFYSEDNTQAARINLHPRVTLPFRLGQALYVEPSAGLQQTAWFVNQYQDVPAEEAKDKNTYRTLYDLRLDVSSEFSNVYAIDGDEWQAFRHTVLPRVVYEYIPEKDQDKYPAFYQQNIDQDANGDYVDIPTPLDDGINRVDPLNMITYSITNSFTSKSIPPAEEEDADQKSDGKPRYNDFLRVKLEQRYNIREARGSERVDPERKRPFSPIRGELEYFPTRYLSLRANAEYDVYDNSLVSRNLSATLSSPRGDELHLEYRYGKGLYRFYRKDAATSENPVESLYGSLRVKLPYRFTVHASNEYDFENNNRIETTLGLLYEAQCWSLDVAYTDEDNDQTISFMFYLYGLGSIGLQ